MSIPIKAGLGMLNVNQITPQLGVEFEYGTQVIEFSDAEVDELKALAANKGIVVARNQNVTNQEQATFAHRLGEPFTSPIDRDDIPEELIVIEADEKANQTASQGWHSDVSSDSKPPSLSMLRIEVIPDAGGDTLFASMYRAFDTLSEPMQAFLERLTARHDPRGHYLYLSGAKTLDKLPYSIHPVVRVHPITQRKALYVNDVFVGRIVELSDRESSSLLKMLYDHIAYSANIQCRVHWEPNTVVFWDNRCVQHCAAFDYFPAYRKGYRATIRGETPCLCPVRG